MKTKIAILMLASCLVALAAWLVNRQDTAPVDQLPEKYNGTVAKGLEYLVKNQHKDGHWEGDDGKHPVAMTGLVGLSLVMSLDERKDIDEHLAKKARKLTYPTEIRKAVEWLLEMSKAERDGLIFSGHESETARYMEGHGLATLFLAGACAYETDEARQKKLRHVLLRAVSYIAKAQSTQGGWYHTSRVEGHDFADVMSTVIQIQALQAAENTGCAVPAGSIDHAHGFLTKAVDKNSEHSNLNKNRNRQLETAAALASGIHLQDEPALGRVKSKLSREEWFQYCKSEIAVGRATEFGRDELIHYYFAQAAFQNTDPWKDYRTAMFDQLLASQNKDGSWTASDGISVGAVYSTALWCTILQLDNGRHPVSFPPRYTMMTRGPEFRRMREGRS